MKPGVSLSLRKSTKPDLERLKVLDAWSEQPVVEQREALAQPSEEPKTEPRKGHQKGASDAGQGAGQGDTPGTVATPPAPVYPWQDESLVVGSRQINLRIPAVLFHKLKWIADTTYGESMTSIVLNDIMARVERTLKERGIDG